MIVVEGVDGSGKTTLANQLGEQLGWPVLHWSNPGRTSAAGLLPYLLHGPVILDRGHLTPQVYGEVLRGKPDLTPYDYWALTGVLEAKRTTTILCDVPTEVAWENVKSRSQLFPLTYEQLEALRQGFLLEKYCCTYNYQDGYDFTYVEPGFDLPNGVVGSWCPDVWLVGDEKKNIGPLEEVPFYDPGISDKLFSGTLLFRAMTDSGLHWKRTALSNSRLWGKNVDLDEVHYLLGKPAVIALGNDASWRLKKHEIKHERVTHPQWWRRFNHHDPEGYTRQLSDAIERALGAQKVAG